MPVQNTITVKDSEVRSALKNALLAVRNLPAKVIVPELEAARDELRTYPPELAGQRYVRTGRRYRATRLEARAGNNQYSKSYVLKSDPVYPGGRTADPYVVGNAYGQGQATIHVGRWKLLSEVAARAVERIVEKGTQAFRDAISKGPGGL